MKAADGFEKQRLIFAEGGDDLDPVFSETNWDDDRNVIVGVTIPSFVIATGLIYFFSFKLGWIPVYGVDKWQGYILPVIAMGGYSVSFLTRLMRSSLLDVMGQDYIRTARAKGISETRVILKHALRNALIPVIKWPAAEDCLCCGIIRRTNLRPATCLAGRFSGGEYDGMCYQNGGWTGDAL